MLEVYATVEVRRGFVIVKNSNKDRPLRLLPLLFQISQISKGRRRSFRILEIYATV